MSLNRSRHARVAGAAPTRAEPGLDRHPVPRAPCRGAGRIGAARAVTSISRRSPQNGDVLRHVCCPAALHNQTRVAAGERLLPKEKGRIAGFARSSRCWRFAPTRRRGLRAGGAGEVGGPQGERVLPIEQLYRDEASTLGKGADECGSRCCCQRPPSRCLSPWSSAGAPDRFGVTSRRRCGRSAGAVTALAYSGRVASFPTPSGRHRRPAGRPLAPETIAAAASATRRVATPSTTQTSGPVARLATEK